MDNTVQNHEVGLDVMECKRVYTSQDQQNCSVWQGATPEINAKLNGPSGLIDFQTPVIHTNADRHRERFNENDKMAKGNGNWSQNWLTGTYFHLELSRNHRRLKEEGGG